MSIIRTPDYRLRVFISSTLRELLPERQAARAAVETLRMSPVMFELGARPHPPRNLYRAYLDQSHVFVGIYWQSYGWVAPDETVSGLHDEYNLSAALPRLIYVKEPAPERHDRLAELLGIIERDDRASYRIFSSAEELQGLLTDDLAVLLTERFEAVSRPVDEPSPATAADSVHATVPLPGNATIGREEDVQRVADLLGSPSVRLVTLTGPGGTGKTRLAMEVARLVEPQFPAGVVFVDLTMTSSSDGVVSALAAALGLDAGPMPMIDTIAGALSTEPVLLVVDNFEHVVAAAVDLAHLLKHAPALKVIATSRVPLRIAAEHQFAVAPLALPPPGKRLRADVARGFGAVALFEQRAQVARPSFVLDDGNAGAVADICRRVDGLPLAIELAAARVRLLAPAALLERLDRRLALLTSGAADAPQRHQTLRNTITWSVDLLDDDCRVVLLPLSVFVGAFDIDGAVAVTGPSSDPIAVLDGIDTLVSASLVVTIDQADGDVRFAMLETIREHVHDLLVEQQRADEVAASHLRYVTSVVERVEPDLHRGDRTSALATLSALNGDVEAALEWGVAHAADEALRLAAGIAYYWTIRGDRRHGVHWLQRAIAAAPHADMDVQRRSRHALGVLLDLTGDAAGAAELFTTALAAARQSDSDDDVAAELNSLGITLRVLGRLDEANDCLSEALELRLRLGDRERIASALSNLGVIAMSAGRVEEARARFTEALAIDRQIDDGYGTAVDAVNLGFVAVTQQRADDARPLLEESLRLFAELQDGSGVANALEGCAALAQLTGEPTATAHLLGAADRLRAEAGEPRPQVDDELLQRLLAPARDEVAADAWDSAIATGAHMEFDEAVDAGLALLRLRAAG